MEATDRPMSPLMKVVFWFVAVNALVGAFSLIFFPSDTARLFFWEIKPSINAALLILPVALILPRHSQA